MLRHLTPARVVARWQGGDETLEEYAALLWTQVHGMGWTRTVYSSGGADGPRFDADSAFVPYALLRETPYAKSDIANAIQAMVPGVVCCPYSNLANGDTKGKDNGYLFLVRVGSSSSSSDNGDAFPVATVHKTGARVHTARELACNVWVHLFLHGQWEATDSTHLAASTNMANMFSMADAAFIWDVYQAMVALFPPEADVAISLCDGRTTGPIASREDLQASGEIPSIEVVVRKDARAKPPVRQLDLAVVTPNMLHTHAYEQATSLTSALYDAYAKTVLAQMMLLDRAAYQLRADGRAEVRVPMPGNRDRPGDDMDRVAATVMRLCAPYVDLCTAITLDTDDDGGAGGEERVYFVIVFAAPAPSLIAATDGEDASTPASDATRE